MFNNKQLPPGQKWFIKYMEISRYASPDVKYKEFCHGVAHVSKDAFLIGELNQFIERFHVLNSIPPEKFASSMKSARKKRIKHTRKIKNQSIPNEVKEKLKAEAEAEFLDHQKLKTQDQEIKTWEQLYRKKINQYIQRKINESIEHHLSLKNRILLNVPPFFEAVVLYHKAHLFPHLFETGKAPIGQNAEAATSLVESKRLADMGGDKKILSFSGMYDSTELNTYFKNLQETLRDTNRIVILLHTINHSFSICYDPATELWNLIDAEKISEEPIKDVGELVTNIFTASSADHTIALYSEIYCLKKYADSLEKKLKTWQQQEEILKMHNLNSTWKYLQEDENGGTWLYVAAISGDIEQVKILLNKGANPNQKEKEGSSVLIDTLSMGHFEVAKSLINAGADPNYINPQTKHTALFLAVSLGDLEFVKFMLSKGAVLENKFDNDETALMIAVQENNLDMVKLLLAHKANPNVENSYQESPVSIAIIHRHIDMMTALLAAGADPNITSGFPPLCLAIFQEDTKMIEALLKHGAKVDEPVSCTIETFLDEAREYGFEDLAYQFLDAHCDASAWCVDISPLQMAELIGNQTIETNLLKYQSASPHMPGKFEIGKTKKN